jgi:predicted porin
MRSLSSFFGAVLVACTLCSAAWAQDSPQVYGVIRLFVDSDRVGHQDPGMRVTSFVSKVGFRATEALQSDLRLNFVAETALWPDNGRRVPAYIGDERITVGVSATNFSVDLGRQQHNTWAMLKRYHWTADLYGSFAGEIHSRQGLRFGNAVFATWQPLPGTWLAVDSSMSETAGVPNSQSYSVNHRVTSSLETGLAYFTNNLSNTSVLWGLRWAMPNQRTVLFSLVSQDQINAVQRNGYSMGFAHAITERVSVNGGVGHRSDSVDAANAGVEYAFSKNVRLQLRGQWVNSAEPIVFTTANDLTGATATHRRQIGFGIEYKL